MCNCHFSFSLATLPFVLGEQHGFRKAENIKFALDGEFYFYSKVFGFEAPGIDVDVSIWSVYEKQSFNAGYFGRWLNCSMWGTTDRVQK